MTDVARESILQRVRQALRRSEPLKTPPVPPIIDEPITRLVHMAIGLGELFAKRALENQMQVELVNVEQLMERLTEFVREQKCRKIALAASAFLEQLNVYQALKEAGLEVCCCTEATAGEMDGIDCGITDVYCAVAEVGGLVFRATPERPRSLSLFPRVHIVILKPPDFVPDLVDLFEKINQDGLSNETVIITGPAQATEIEMTRIFGVSGPRIVRAFVLR